MKVYYVANSRKVCSNVEQAVAQAVKDMGITYRDDERYAVSKPMVVENRWGEKRLVVTIYDKKYNKLRMKRRKIDIVDLDKEKYIQPIEYLGQF
jgi:hypothetical protein